MDEAEAMEQRLSAILQAHDAELQSVYAAIVDKRMIIVSNKNSDLSAC